MTCLPEALVSPKTPAAHLRYCELCKLNPETVSLERLYWFHARVGLFPKGSWIPRLNPRSSGVKLEHAFMVQGFNVETSSPSYSDLTAVEIYFAGHFGHSSPHDVLSITWGIASSAGGLASTGYELPAFSLHGIGRCQPGTADNSLAFQNLYGADMKGRSSSQLHRLQKPDPGLWFGVLSLSFCPSIVP